MTAVQDEAGLIQLVIDILEREEGKRAMVYDDATGKPVVPGYVMKGHPTIGIGRALDVRGITDAEIRYLLANDITGLLKQVPQLVSNWNTLTANRKAVLICMGFQLGVRGLAGFKATLAAIGRSAYSTAAQNMLASLWAKQTPARVKRMADLMRSG